MSTAFKLSLPVDIPWQLVCVSEDMMDERPCDLRFPPKWNSSLAIHKYVPDEEYQNYPGMKITYLKVTATITGYQPRDEEVQGSLDWGKLDVTTRTGITELLDSYFPCHGAMLQVIVGPRSRDGRDRSRYPYFLDFEPKKRELYEMASDTHERSSRSLETLNISNAAGTTRSLEVMDVDMGGSTSVGAQGSYAGTGGGFNFSTSSQGQWGTRSMNTDAAQTTRTTDMGQEKRETFSHTTQLSQMYHLLDSYHLGTNRAVFFVQPRPHVLEEPSGFVRGPRPVEGIQEFFLVVAQPEDEKDFCVSARLDTSHIATTDIMDYTHRSDISNMANAVARIPNRNDQYVGTAKRRACFISCWDVTYKCYRAEDQDDQIYQAPAGFTITGYDNLVNDSWHGSTSVSIAPGNKTLTVHAEAEGHICFEHSGVCVDCPDEIEKYVGYAKRQVQVNLRSEERDRKVGEEEVLLLTTRGLCCCPTTKEVDRVEGITGIFAIPDELGSRRITGKVAVAADDYAGTFYASGGDPASVRRDAMAAHAKAMGVSMSEADAPKAVADKGHDCDCDGHSEVPEGRKTIRQANGMLHYIRKRMVQSIESADPEFQPKPFVQTDLFMDQLHNFTARSRRGREAGAGNLARIKCGKLLAEAIAKDLEVDVDAIKVRDAFNYRNEELARLAGVDMDAVIDAKLDIIGVARKGKKKPKPAKKGYKDAGDR